jgi:hypothetical protein
MLAIVEEVFGAVRSGSPDEEDDEDDDDDDIVQLWLGEHRN